jgi:hypothetical protein
VKADVLLAAQGLHPSCPFTGVKGQLGGLFLIDARHLNDAVQVAPKVPVGRLGSVKLRPEP